MLGAKPADHDYLSLPVEPWKRCTLHTIIAGLEPLFALALDDKAFRICWPWP